MDPVQLLFCTLYAWNDDELIAPPPTDPVPHFFCTLYAWNDFELIAVLSYRPGSAFILHPICLE